MCEMVCVVCELSLICLYSNVGLQKKRGTDAVTKIVQWIRLGPPNIIGELLEGGTSEAGEVAPLFGIMADPRMFSTRRFKGEIMLLNNAHNN
jgi:hypothetical protein